MIRTLIIDDEKGNREYIASLLHDHFPKVEVIGGADGVISGLKAIRSLSPDLVLLDIRLKEGDAFDILNQLQSIDFRIIFITAYEEYALQAIKFSALDYLLKPLNLSDMRLAIAKAEKQITRDLNLQLAELKNNLQNISNKRIVLRSADKIHVIPITDIIRCEANRNYADFYLTFNRKITVSQPIKHYEEMLVDNGFFRIHKSHIINLNFVETYVKGSTGYIELMDGSQLPVADRKKYELMQFFSNL
jgi:two-component system LytT family response regulator